MQFGIAGRRAIVGEPISFPDLAPWRLCAFALKIIARGAP